MIATNTLRQLLHYALTTEFGDHRIAAIFKCSHNTVRKYRVRARYMGLAWSTIEAMDDLLLIGYMSDRPARDPRKRLPNWKNVLEELEEDGVTLALIHDTYRDLEPASAYSYSQFAELFRVWLGKQDVTMRQVHRPGEKLYIDYSGKPDLRPLLTDQRTGESIPVEIFVAVLGYSSYTYSEATKTQQLHDWIGSNQRALQFFGGVPTFLVPDQLRSAISGRTEDGPIVNRTYQDFARHYDTSVDPARPRRPRDKAPVEVAVQIVQRWICARLRKRTFFSIQEINEEIWKLLKVLNERKFKKREGSRQSVFDAVERKTLRPLPDAAYSFGEWRSAIKLASDYHVDVRGHFYSAPSHLVGSPVEARITAETVELYCFNRRVATHPRSHEIGAATTDRAHMPESHRAYAELSPERFLDWAETIGPRTKAVVHHLMFDKKLPQLGFKSCQSVQKLTQEFGKDRMEAACARALELFSPTVRTVRSLLSRALEDKGGAAACPDTPLPDHANLRGSDYYYSEEQKHAA